MDDRQDDVAGRGFVAKIIERWQGEFDDVRCEDNKWNDSYQLQKKTKQAHVITFRPLARLLDPNEGKL